MYHYTDSGLNNVWLKSGFNIVDTPYGRGVSIDDADGLHALLATDLTKKPGRLTGKELRFFAHNAAPFTAEFCQHASRSGTGRQSLEEAGKVPKPADAMMQMPLLEKVRGDEKMSEITKRINTVERLVDQRIVASEYRHKRITTARSEKRELEHA